MKQLCFFLLAGCLAVGWTAFAGSLEIPESVTMRADQFEDYTPKKNVVTFNHASHMDICCQSCHHTVEDTYTIQGCSSEGCHDDITTKSEPTSFYKAFHTAQDKTRSCLGCHRELKRQGTGDAPVVCNNCHIK